MAQLEAETTLKAIADEIRKGLGNQVLILKSGLLELGLQFIKAFDRDGRGALQGMIEAVQSFDMDPIIKFAEVIVKVFKFIGDNWKILLSIAAAVKAVSIAMGILNLVTVAFNITLAASPVGVVLIAVGLLAAAIVALIANWDELETMFANSKIGKILASGGGGPFSEGFELARRERLANRQQEASGQDPRRQRQAEREALAGVQTPTPSVNPTGNENAISGRGRLDINIRNNAGDNAEIIQRGQVPTGANINFVPAFSE